MQALTLLPFAPAPWNPAKRWGSDSETSQKTSQRQQCAMYGNGSLELAAYAQL